jgi:hypothetical protein
MNINFKHESSEVAEVLVHKEKRRRKYRKEVKKTQKCEEGIIKSRKQE